MPASDGRWSLLLGAVAVYLFAAVGRVHQLLPSVGLLRPTLLAAGLALACIALEPAASRRLGFTLQQPLILAIVMLLAWAACSVPVALYPGQAFDTVVGLAKSAAMVVTVAVAVRGVADLRRLVMVLFAAMSVYSVVVLHRYDTSARLGSLVYYDANEFALVVVATLPFGVYGLWRTKQLGARLAIAGGLAAGFLVFVACGSRGGALAMGAMLSFGVLRFRVLPLRWRLVTLVVVLTSFGAMASESFWRRMDSVVETEDDYNITSPTGRIQVWKRGLGYMLDRPLLGVGAGNFATAEGRLSRYAAMLRERNLGVKWSAAHNTYVQVGAELGVPGLALFLAGITFAIRSLVRAQQTPHGASPQDRELAALAGATLCSFVGFLIGASFLSLAYHDLVFALLALSAGVAFVSQARERERRHHLYGVPG